MLRIHITVLEENGKTDLISPSRKARKENSKTNNYLQDAKTQRKRQNK
jgi:hypothetical protein